MHDRITKGQNQLYTGESAGKVVFMALLWPLQGTDFILLDYMATHTDHRGKNIAAAFLQQMRTELEAQDKYFIIETEDPAFGANTEERTRRLAFYKRNGAEVLEGVRYILPALQGNEPTDMLLMIFPANVDTQIDASLVRSLVTQIYREVYGRVAVEHKLISLSGLISLYLPE
jgi:hypothetical protein